MNWQHKIVLLVKTYRKDSVCFVNLYRSIIMYNNSVLPLYVVVPKEDVSFFRELLAEEGITPFLVILYADEDFITQEDIADTDGYVSQQLVKMNFGLSRIAEFFVIIDSDSYFIREFYTNDFMYDEATPYIVMHEGKEAKLINENLVPSGIYQWEYAIQLYFNRPGKPMRFLTTPIVFSSRVLCAMKEQYCFLELLRHTASEATWHGEFLLKDKTIPYKNTEPFFKCISSQHAYSLCQCLSIRVEDIANVYLGIVVQSRHVAENVYKNPRIFPRMQYCLIKCLRFFIRTKSARNRYNEVLLLLHTKYGVGKKRI